MIRGVNSVSFGAKFYYQTGDTSGINNDQIVKEKQDAEKLKNMGVSVPNYYLALSYETDGETANYTSNPITVKHLDDLFHNMLLMDRGNYNHNDLDIGHVFYNKDGKVQFDCLRFSSPFIKNKSKQYALPDFMMPTNQVNYENASLGFYVKQIPTRKEQISFVKQYLQACSDYHAQKAEYITSRKDENYTDEMLQYERIQAAALVNPDDTITDLMLDRLNFLRQQREAFTEFDEGNGSCGHTFSKERRIKSIPMYMEAIKSAIDYSYKAKDLAQNTFGIKSKYYDYEAKTGEYFVNTYLSWVKGMAEYNFQDDRVCPLGDTGVQEMNAEYQKMIDADFADKENTIDEYLKKYDEKTS